jgi:predicted peptidase
MQAVVKILDSLERVYSLDPTRYYVSGLSMGGYGAWYLMMRFPERFAAAVPVCGAGDPKKSSLIANTPVWAFHGADDAVVPVNGSRDMISALQRTLATVKYTEYPASQKVGHASWVPAGETAGLADWVYQHSRNTVALASHPKVNGKGGWTYSNRALIRVLHRRQVLDFLGRR